MLIGLLRFAQGDFRFRAFPVMPGSTWHSEPQRAVAYGSGCRIKSGMTKNDQAQLIDDALRSRNAISPRSTRLSQRVLRGIRTVLRNAACPLRVSSISAGWT